MTLFAPPHPCPPLALAPFLTQIAYSRLCCVMPCVMPHAIQGSKERPYGFDAFDIMQGIPHPHAAQSPPVQWLNSSFRASADLPGVQVTYLSAPDANLSPRVSAFRTMRTLDRMLRPAFCHLSITCCLCQSSSSLSLNTPAPTNFHKWVCVCILLNRLVSNIGCSGQQS